MKCVVNLDYDDDADVWIATSPQVTGLVLESGSLDALAAEVQCAIPELVTVEDAKGDHVDVTFVSCRQQRVMLNG